MPALARRIPHLGAEPRRMRPRFGLEAVLARGDLGPRQQPPSHPREGTPVTSGASAADSVRRESAWQRAGPPGGSDPMEDAMSRPWFARDGADAGPPRWTSLRAARSNPWGTDRSGRPSGRTVREPSRRSSLPDPKPQERDRMKHAGRLWRGATRQGREKRRRRTEASVGARDEEPGPIGTCTAVLSSGKGPRAVIPFLAPHATDFGPQRANRGTGGGPEHGRPRSGPGVGHDGSRARTIPSGTDRAPPPEGLASNRTLWATTARQRSGRLPALG